MDNTPNSAEQTDSNAIKPSQNFEYYIGQIYWNNFEAQKLHVNHSISGRKDIDWYHYLKERYGSFQRCFSINCGNGWA